MDVYDTIESILDSNNGYIIGRTAIQKLVYLSKQKVPELEIPDYHPHYYGPYCPEVGLALEKLVSYSFVSEEIHRGNRHSRYAYRLTEDGKNAVGDIKTKYQSQYDAINEVVQTCKKSCNLKILSLSFAAKVFMLYHDQDSSKVSHDDIKNRGNKLNWDLQDGDIDDGIALLEELKFVKFT